MAAILPALFPPVAQDDGVPGGRVGGHPERSGLIPTCRHLAQRHRRSEQLAVHGS